MAKVIQIPTALRSVYQQAVETRTGRQRLLHGSLHITMVFLSVVALVPIAYMISTSLKATGKEYEWPVRWIPDPIVWRNYLDAHTIMTFNLYYRNTIAVAVLATTGALISSTMAGYAFARLRFVGRNVLFVFTLATMMLPGVVTLVPTFIIFRELHWINTLYPLIVPFWFGGGAFFIFLTRQFFMGVPYELEEAARIDGASSFRIYWQMMLPLSGPVLAVIAVFSFVDRWTEFLHPLIYLNTNDLRTVALGLAYNRGLFSEHRNFIMAASFTMSLPIILLFFFAQRYFMRGIVMTGITGR